MWIGRTGTAGTAATEAFLTDSGNGALSFGFESSGLNEDTEGGRGEGACSVIVGITGTAGLVCVSAFLLVSCLAAGGAVGDKSDDEAPVDSLGMSVDSRTSSLGTSLVADEAVVVGGAETWARNAGGIYFCVPDDVVVDGTARWTLLYLSSSS